MNLKFINVSEYKQHLKATVQKSGRMGFTDDTAKALKLGERKFVKFAQDADNSDAWFMLVSEKHADSDDNYFDVCSSGKYYYLPTKTMFEAMGIDFVNNNIIYDLTPVDGGEELGGSLYKMNRRIMPRGGNSKDDKD